MKTDDLIKAIAADAKSISPPINRTLAMAVGVGTAISALLFLWDFGMRGDFWESLGSSWRFAFKFVMTLSIAIPAFVLIRGLARPDFRMDKKLWWLALGPAVLLSGVIVELIVLPQSAWEPRMVGQNSMYCLIVIPMLSLAPLVASIYALRQGATTHPLAAGAVGGLLSGAIAATLYAAHCPDDSPLFLAAWYSIAIVLMTALGALIGQRFLRW